MFDLYTMFLHATCLHGLGGKHIYFIFNKLYPMAIIYIFHIDDLHDFIVANCFATEPH
jgi:hypothetical protein